MSVNDKLKSFVYSLKLLKSARHPNSPLNTEEYNPTEALNNLQSHLTTVLKSGAYSGPNSLSSQDYIVQKNPYSAHHLIQFEENARAEPMTQRALHRQNDFLFGHGIKTVLDTMDDDFDTTEAKSEAVSAIMSKQEYLNAKKVVDKVNRRVNFRQKARAAVYNCKVYGRSALLKEYIDSKDEHPTSLYIMNSKLLGNVYCDKSDPGHIAYVEYNSNEVSKYNDKIYYEPEDIIYFTNFDYHVSPNTLYYGLSDLEPIKDIGETNRVINEEDNKEFARGLWAGNILFKLPNLHNSTEVENLLSHYDPGKPVAITSDITAEPLQMPTNLDQVTDLNIQNDRRILRSTGTPTTAFFEEITNRATVQFILHAFKETHVEQQRVWFKDIVEPQWIYPIWAKELGYEPEAMEELDAKLTIEFMEYNFDTFEQKVNVWLPIAQAGYISIERFLEEIGYPQLAEEYKKNKKELMQQRKEQMEAQGFGNPLFNKFKMQGPKDDPTEDQGAKKGGGEEGSVGGSDL